MKMMFWELPSSQRQTLRISGSWDLNPGSRTWIDQGRCCGLQCRSDLSHKLTHQLLEWWEQGAVSSDMCLQGSSLDPRMMDPQLDLGDIYHYGSGQSHHMWAPSDRLEGLLFPIFIPNCMCGQVCLWVWQATQLCFCVFEKRAFLLCKQLL